nr:hypothetical protein [Candidatus Freyarchaeota archaeon]
MNTNISFKEFMDQVEERLKAYSPETLREIIMEWARNTHPSKRHEFLAMLIPPSLKQQAPDRKLLKEISKLAKRVENGDYCEGWGWDEEIGDERDWGDESWADETDEFFTRACEAMMAGNYQLAKEAYAQLFDILEMGEEPGHLPGSPDPTEMLKTDLNDARACYLRSVYLSSPIDKRPAELLEAIQRFSFYAGDSLNLKSVINAGQEPLPDFPEFLSRWFDLLKGASGHWTHYLLYEAAMLSGGTSAIEKLAREESKRYPRAYVKWIEALEREGNYHSMFEAAKEGLENVPRDYAVRGEIAEGLVRAAEHLNDVEAQLLGWREAFYSNPSLSRLLSLLSVAEQRDRYREEIDTAITRVVSLLRGKKKYQDYSFAEDSEKQESTASESLLTPAYLLAGQIEDALNLCKSKGALGWSYGENPKGLIIPFLLRLLSQGKNLYSTQNLEQLWEEAVTTTAGSTISGYGYGRRDVADRFQQAMGKVFQSVQLSEDEEIRYIRWCTEEIKRRVDAIVGEKHRKSYDKAANLLVALAEVLANRGMKSDGAELIEKYRQKYRHYSAFKQELNKALRESNIFE